MKKKNKKEKGKKIEHARGEETEVVEEGRK